MEINLEAYNWIKSRIP